MKDEKQIFVNCSKHSLSDNYSKCKNCHWEFLSAYDYYSKIQSAREEVIEEIPRQTKYAALKAVLRANFLN